mmetsp:Transcript_99592/g.277253  ORF Transcript_99592/g.277253 Transcript_99592/m.277253 type:complete len:188 (-) Transcript_99592:77-640(-)
MEAQSETKSVITGGFGTVPAQKAKDPIKQREGPDGGGAGGGSTAASSSSSQPLDRGGGDGVEDLFAQVDVRWMSSARLGADGTVICVECGREGHPCCGLRYWTSLRAAWLRISEEDIVCEPTSFEDPGPLQLARADQAGPIRDLSEGELEDLEDCLDAVQRPFPRLRRSVPLMQAVQCAEALWDTDD